MLWEMIPLDNAGKEVMEDLPLLHSLRKGLVNQCWFRFQREFRRLLVVTDTISQLQSTEISMAGVTITNNNFHTVRSMQMSLTQLMPFSFLRE